MTARKLAVIARQRRKDAGLTQEELAEKLAASGRYDAPLSKQAISKAENYEEGDGMTSLRIAIVEELSSRKIVGPLWGFEDDLKAA